MEEEYEMRGHPLPVRPLLIYTPSFSKCPSCSARGMDVTRPLDTNWRYICINRKCHGAIREWSGDRIS